MNPPAPGPVSGLSAIHETSAAPTAASTAFPPAARTSAPACAVNGCPAATAPLMRAGYPGPPVGDTAAQALCQGQSLERAHSGHVACLTPDTAAKRHVPGTVPGTCLAEGARARASRLARAICGVRGRNRT